MGRVDIGEALTTSFNVFLKNIGVMVLGGLILVVTSFCAILMPPLMVGLYIMCLKALRGQDVQVGDVFEGFSHLGPAYLVAVVPAVIAVLLYFIAALPLAGAMGLARGEGGEAAAGALVGTVVVLMMVVTIAVLLLAPIFGLAFPAVADGMGGVEALTFSYQRGLANWPALFVLSICIAVAQGIVGIVGSVTAGLPSILALPWSGVLIATAYLQVTGEAPAAGGAGGEG